MSDLDKQAFLRAAATFHVAGVLEGEAFREAPATKRFQEAWRRALADHDRWREIVEGIRSELPGVSVGETTAPYFMAARRCCVYLKSPGPSGSSQPYSIVVALASVLVPYYHLYQLEADTRTGGYIKGQPQPRPKQGPEGRVADVLAHRLEQDLGFKEFPSEYESIVVPEICVGNLLPGQATLLDALFDASRDNVP